MKLRLLRLFSVVLGFVPMQTMCPACHGTSQAFVRSFTASQAAQHFVLREADTARHDALETSIRRLWSGNTCDILRCTFCGFTYAWPYIAGDVEFYNLAYPRAAYPNDRWEYGRTIEALNGKAGRVLEIGAGRGVFLDKLKAKSATAIEYNETSCAALREKGYLAILGDVRELDLDPVDTVCMFQVLEHIDRLDDIISKLYLITPEVFVSVPNIEWTAFNEANGGLYDMPPNHIGQWTRKAFEEAWGRHGFRIADFDVEPVRITDFARNDLTYSLMRRSQESGSTANMVRTMERGLTRTALQSAVAVANIPSRLPIWIDAIRQKNRLGSTVWVHLKRSVFG